MSKQRTKRKKRKQKQREMVQEQSQGVGRKRWRSRGRHRGRRDGRLEHGRAAAGVQNGWGGRGICGAGGGLANHIFSCRRRRSRLACRLKLLIIMYGRQWHHRRQLAECRLMLPEPCSPTTTGDLPGGGAPKMPGRGHEDGLFRTGPPSASKPGLGQAFRGRLRPRSRDVQHPTPGLVGPG
jgi:hypothetical protein